MEDLRTRQNAASKEIGKSAPDERPAKIAAASALKEELAVLEPALAAADATLRELALQVPNPADASVPDGGEDDGEVIKIVGEPPAGAPAFDHATLAERFGWVDAERGAEASGSRFAYLMGEAVLLELALVQWVMGRLVEEGFTPVVPPVLVREHVMEEAGFFPTDRSQVYDLPDDELFLVGTSEVPLSALNRGDAARRGRAADPVRRLLHQLPAGGGHLRQGHAGHLPGAPVRQARDVLDRHARSSRGRSTSESSRSRNL